MKRASLLFDCIVIIVLLASCSANRSIHRATEKIEGTWQLQKIVSEGVTGNINIQLFNEADFQCFIGSTWQFSDDIKGNYSFRATTGEHNCVAVNRMIKWKIYSSADSPMLLQFKRLGTDGKEIDPNYSGFIFTIIQSDNHQMQLRSDVTFEGKPAAFIYNFIKI